jgi:hypothetical protein
MPRFLQAGCAVHAVPPAIARPFAAEAAAWPLGQGVVPALLQPAHRRWGETWRLGSPEGLERLGAIPCRAALEGQPGSQRLEAFRPPSIRGPERRVQAHPEATTLSHTGILAAHRTKPGVHLALWQGAMAAPAWRPWGSWWSA